MGLSVYFIANNWRKMVVAGLDLSINSTGVCIYDTDTKRSIYYIIGSKFTKKALAYQHQRLSLISYEKQTVDSKTDYSVKEDVKTYNIYKIVSNIRRILFRHDVEAVAIEGISFGSTGSAALIDLSGLNYMTRMTVIELDIPFMYIVSPTQNKKFASGNGSAEKDVMISAWNKMDRDMAEIADYVKVDDIADAYFLARYAESLLIT